VEVRVLNDIPKERRLAYLLDFTLERRACRAGFWTPRARITVGMAIFLLLVLLQLLV
jgi:hypothetical protein